ncbi:Uncharacterized protein TCM_008555 [Theobroma cacao]|uniref:Uncharacterized protein n=1 Tax=Theobroma cacao TaxID=3641 RepID=A0A061E3Z5_THECC|nr:Uncharacterized protein TCM_008555 [Theobroma cacao]
MAKTSLTRKVTNKGKEKRPIEDSYVLPPKKKGKMVLDSPAEMKRESQKKMGPKTKRLATTKGISIEKGSLDETPLIKADLSRFFDELKIKALSTFEDRYFSPTLVREFYSSITLNKYELEDPNDFVENGLMCYCVETNLKSLSLILESC